MTFPSANGSDTVHACFFLPDGEPRAIVQLSHGMVDHIGRYTELVEALTDAGYLVCGNDHLGHGKTARDEQSLGYLGRRGAWQDMVDDLAAMSEQARARYPRLKLFLLGHSMGSFLARLYAERYGAGLDGLILLGTAGRNPAASAGILLADLLALLRGRRYRSRMLAAIAFAGYNRYFKKERSRASWLTRDAECRKRYSGDPLCKFTFTVSAYRELFDMLRTCNRREWFTSLPKELPVHIASGIMDPVGGYAKGVKRVIRGLSDAGMTRVTAKLYPSARHELHKELNRREFFDDLLLSLAGMMR